MKLIRITIENARSFLIPQTLELDNNVSILIGPNGGGKTNALDIILSTMRNHFVRSWSAERRDDGPSQFNLITANLNQLAIEAHRDGKKSTIIKVWIEVTLEDLSNIRAIRADASKLADLAKSKYRSSEMDSVRSWPEIELRAGQILDYIVEAGQVIEDTPAKKLFRRYLNLFEMDAILRNAAGLGELSTPMLYLPVGRTANPMQSRVTLANHSDSAFKQSVDGASSKSPGDPFLMALGRMARRWQSLIDEDRGDGRQRFYELPTMRRLTQKLAELGYSFELEKTDFDRNGFEIKLTKGGHSFDLGAASSGERSILTYLVGLNALNVRNALIVIDEPELHLHPKWQTALIRIIEDLAQHTGNQFVMATHSPTFISPSTIGYVSRVYSNGSHSHIVRLDKTDLDNRRHLFSVINSHNNERLFFADKVVLVEGVSDRIFFEKLLARSTPSVRRIIEVIDVGGKHFFEPYRKVLKACQIPHSVIADRDFLAQVGSSVVKSICALSEQKLKAGLTDKGSLDGRAFTALLRHAIQTGDLKELTAFWCYLETRYVRLPVTLSPGDQTTVERDLKRLKRQGIFILPQGALEAYLPSDLQKKDVNELITFLDRTDWFDLLPALGKRDLAALLRWIRKS